MLTYNGDTWRMSDVGLRLVGLKKVSQGLCSLQIIYYHPVKLIRDMSTVPPHVIEDLPYGVISMPEIIRDPIPHSEIQ